MSCSMKKSAQYARQIKQLVARLKKEKAKVALPAIDDPMHALLLGILGAHASEQRAETALSRMLAAAVDLNEVRVTSVSELVTNLGTDFPSVRPAAEEISHALNAVFNRIHRLDLSFLKAGSRKAAETFLDSLDGVGAHAKATVMLRCLGDRVVPIDRHMLLFLQRSGCVPENATPEEAQKLVTNQVSERDVAVIYVALKRHAAAHTPRKLPVSRPAPPPPAVAKPAEKDGKTEAKTKAAGAAKTPHARKSEKEAGQAEPSPAGKAAAKTVVGDKLGSVKKTAAAQTSRKAEAR